MKNLTELKQRLVEQALSNPELQAELSKLGIKPTDLESMSSKELTALMSPKMMGMIGMSWEDWKDFQK